MNKIVVTQPIAIQRHVLKIAEEKTEEEVVNIIKSLENNKSHATNNKNREYLKVWSAYSRGWRGNFAEPEPRISDDSKATVTSVVVTKKKQESICNDADLTISDEPKSKPYEKPTDLDVASKYMSLHSNAKQRQKDFNLTLVDVRRLLTIKHCEYTGTKLTKAISSPPQLTDRTIDRLDESKGYVQGNVFAVCHQSNALKNVLFECESEHKTTVEFMHEMTGRIINLSKESK